MKPESIFFSSSSSLMQLVLLLLIRKKKHVFILSQSLSIYALVNCFVIRCVKTVYVTVIRQKKNKHFSCNTIFFLEQPDCVCVFFLIFFFVIIVCTSMNIFVYFSRYILFFRCCFLGHYFQFSTSGNANISSISFSQFFLKKTTTTNVRSLCFVVKIYIVVMQ